MQGDIIIKVDGQRINSNNDLAAVIEKKKIGDTIDVALYRNNNQMDVQATLQAAPQ